MKPGVNDTTGVTEIDRHETRSEDVKGARKPSSLREEDVRWK